MKRLIKKLRKAFAIFFVSGSAVYRYGTHFKIGYGRCYCIEKENFIGNWITVFETNNEHEWNKMCENYR